MKKKIIWHLNENRWNSAITEYALSCAASLENRGYSNYFFARSDAPCFLRARQIGLRVFGLSCWWDLFFIIFFIFKRSHRPEAVFCYNGKDAFSALLLKIFFRTKIFRFKGDQRQGFKNFFTPFSLYYLSFFDKVFVPSLSMKQFLLDLGLKKTLISSVTLGLSEESFSKEVFQKACLSRKNSRPFLLIFGRLDPIKGHGFFLHIFKEFLSLLKVSCINLPSPQLKICGLEANLKVKELEEIAETLQLKLEDDIVIDQRFAEDKNELLAQASIGIISSLGSEWICRVAEEFLMSGTPIFVSGVGSLKDVLSSSVFGEDYGLLEGDIQQIAKQLFEFYVKVCDLTDTQRLAIAKKAKQTFNLEAMSQSLTQEMIF